MKLGVVYGAPKTSEGRPPCGAACLLCEWTCPEAGDLGEALLLGHLRDVHCRWRMVSSSTEVRKGQETRYLEGPRWQDRSL